jgi:hydrogenase maturation protease
MKLIGLHSPMSLQNTGARPPEELSDPDPDKTATGKTVVLGLGNPYLRDDGVGIAVAVELQRTNLEKGALVRAQRTFDLLLLSEFGGASRLIIVDAVKSGSAPGTVTEYEVAPRPCPLSSLPGLHSLELHDLIDLAGRMGLLSCPVTIIGVEPMDCRVGEGLTPEVERAIPEVVALVAKRSQLRANK